MARARQRHALHALALRVAIGLCEDLRRRVRRFELDAAIASGDEKRVEEELGDATSYAGMSAFYQLFK